MISLVTGATGFIGRQLVQRLLATGDEVHVLLAERPTLGPRLHLLDPDVRPHRVDLRYAGGVKRAVKVVQPNRVFHLAAAGVSDPFLDVRVALRVNLDGTLNLLRAVAGSAPVIVARTPGERAALNVYATSKAAAWQFCRMYHRTEGWPIIGAMIFSAYGAGQNPRNVIPSALAAARAGRDFPMSPGEQQRDWVAVTDVVAALVAIAAASDNLSGDGLAGKTVEIGSGIGTPLHQVIELVYASVGSSGRPLPGHLPYRPGEIMAVVADAERTAAQTGWRATIDLTSGIQRLAQAENA